MSIQFLVTREYVHDDMEDDLLPPAFRVISLTSLDGTDYTLLLDLDKKFISFLGLALDIAEHLGVDPDEVELEEV